MNAKGTVFLSEKLFLTIDVLIHKSRKRLLLKIEYCKIYTLTNRIDIGQYTSQSGVNDSKTWQKMQKLKFLQ